MQFLKREDFYLQRVLLELDLKEVLVELFEKYYISSYDVMYLTEVLLNLRDIGLVSAMISKSGKFELNKLVLETSKEEFAKLLLRYCDIEDEIKKYDKVFSETFKDPYKKRLQITERLNLSIKEELDYIYKTAYSTVIGGGNFKEVVDLGLVGCFVVCKSFEEFIGCPLWQSEEGYLVPFRNVKDKKDLKASSNKSISRLEVSSFNLNGVLNAMMVSKSKGLVKGLLNNKIPVNEIWEVCKE